MKLDVLIKDKGTGDLVMAALDDEIDPGELAAVEASWSPVRQAAVARLLAEGLTPREIAYRLQHAHWNWVSKVPSVALLATKLVGIQYGNEWQGLAMLEAGTRNAFLAPDRGKPLVYVDYLESAPWNLADFVDEPRYGLIGFRLMEYAIRFSQAEGFNGRVGLLALPQAEEFYEQRCGMSRVIQAGQHGMAWFEFTRDRAQAFLSGGGR